MSNLIDAALQINQIGIQNIVLAAQGMAAKVTSGIKLMQFEYSKVGNTVGELATRIENLKKSRSISVDLNDIKTANKQIALAEKQLKQLESGRQISIVRKIMYSKFGHDDEGRAKADHILGIVGKIAKLPFGVAKMGASALGKGAQLLGKGAVKLSKSGIEKAGDIGKDWVQEAYKKYNPENGSKKLSAKEMDNPLAKVVAKASGMKESVADLGEQFVTALAPAADKLLTAFQPLIDKLPVLLNRLTPYFEKLMSVFEGLIPSIMALGSGLWDVLQPILDFATGDAMKGLAHSILEVATKITAFLVPVLNIMKPIAEILVGVITKALDLIGKAFEGLTILINKIIDWWNSLGIGKTIPKLTTPAPITGAIALKPPKEVKEKETRKERKMQHTAGKMGSSISSGGPRQIIMNLNNPLIKEQIFNVSSMKEAVQVSLREQEELLVRMLSGAAAAIA